MSIECIRVTGFWRGDGFYGDGLDGKILFGSFFEVSTKKSFGCLDGFRWGEDVF